MNKKFKSINLKNYSKQLLNEFLKLKSKIIPSENYSELRHNIFNNNHYKKLVYDVQKTYLSLRDSNKDVNILDKFNYDEKSIKILNNKFQQKLRNTYNTVERNNILNIDSIDSKYMANDVKEKINNQRIYVIELKQNICNVNIEIRFYLETTLNSTILKKINRILYRIMFMIEYS